MKTIVEQPGDYSSDCENFEYIVRDIQKYKSITEYEGYLLDRKKNIELALQLDNLELLN